MLPHQTLTSNSLFLLKSFAVLRIVRFLHDISCRYVRFFHASSCRCVVPEVEGQGRSLGSPPSLKALALSALSPPSTRLSSDYVGDASDVQNVNESTDENKQAFLVGAIPFKARRPSQARHRSPRWPSPSHGRASDSGVTCYLCLQIDMFFTAEL